MIDQQGTKPQLNVQTRIFSEHHLHDLYVSKHILILKESDLNLYTEVGDFQVNLRTALSVHPVHASAFTIHMNAFSGTACIVPETSPIGTLVD